MGYADLNALAPVLKLKYNQRKFYELGYQKHPLWSMIRKATDMGGEGKVVAFRYGLVGAGSPTFPTAQLTASPSTFGRFTVSRARDYVVCYIDTETLRVTKSSDDALEKASKEIDSAIMRATRNNAINFYRNKGGAIGNATFNGTTATLVTSSGVAAPWLVTNFEKNMQLEISGSDGNSGSVRTGTPVKVVGRDISAGTITSDVAWTTAYAGAASNDYLFVRDSFGKRMAGIDSWIPQTAPSSGESFFGQDRSDDYRKYGLVYNNHGGAIEEGLVEGLAQMAREGAETDLIPLNPLDWSNCVKAMGSRIVYTEVKNDAGFGFQGFRIIGPNGAVDVIADLNCPKGRAYLLQLDTWSFESSGPAPGILDEDGLGPFIRAPNADAVECRIGWYGNAICEAPGLNMVVIL